MTTETKNEIVKPFIVLLCICLAASALLSCTNMLTKDVIEENKRITAEKTRAAVLTTASSFSEVACDLDALGIDGAYVDDGGSGYVMAAHAKGYGGDVTVTVGLDNDGSVVGISVDTGSETSGVGTKASGSDYLAKYFGISGTADNVDTITGASYSSKAVRSSVSAVLAAFNTVKEAAK